MGLKTSGLGVKDNERTFISRACIMKKAELTQKKHILSSSTPPKKFNGFTRENSQVESMRLFKKIYDTKQFKHFYVIGVNI